MKPYTYLLINFFTIIVCFIFSFHPRIRFDRYFGTFLKSTTLVAIPFIIWDSLFTHYGIWWFNTDYTLNLNIAGLPLEECLFFYCIPFACIFTYYCLTQFFDLSSFNKYDPFIVVVSVTFCVAIAFLFPTRTYTFVTALITAITLTYLQWVAKVNWIGQASIIYCVLLLGFFPVNGILTGTGLESPIVNYNPDTFLNLRMLTIPIEDAVYGYTLFVLNIHFFKRLKKLRTELLN